MEKCIIAAVADNGAIGKDNDLLWHIAEDMKYFRRTTTGNPVVMGYRTFLSIGRPLPKRDNIVISTRSWDDVPEGVKVAGNLEEAYSLVEKAAKSKVNDTAVDVEVSEKRWLALLMAVGKQSQGASSSWAVVKPTARLFLRRTSSTLRTFTQRLRMRTRSSR